MVEHLLRACLPELAAVDFSDLQLSTEYAVTKSSSATAISGACRREVSADPAPVQASGWRCASSRTGLPRARNEAPGIADGRLPAVLPIVHNGMSRGPRRGRCASWSLRPDRGWRVFSRRNYLLLDVQRVAADDLPGRNLLRAVAALEQSRSFQDVLRVREALQLWLRDPRATELQRAFVDWMRQIAEQVAPAGAVVPPVRTWEDVRMTLVERAAEWPKQWLREGREQGLEQGLEQQRALLCRQAAARFDDDTAARLADVLTPIADPERLAEIGDWLVRCDTAAEFLARLDPGSP